MLNILNMKIEDFGASRKEAVLSNGIKVIVFERSRAPVFIRTSFRAGSRYDTKSKEGIAHFLEHMLVAGSKKFPTKDKMAEYIERLGGSFGGWTNDETLAFEVGIGDANDLKYAVEVLHEILLGPLFDNKTIEMERGAILKEIGMSKSSPSGIQSRAYQSLLYQETEIAHHVLGSEKSLGGINKKDIVDFYEENINSENCVIVASGEIDIKEFTNLLEARLKLKSGRKFNDIKKTDLPVVRNNFLKFNHRDFSDQVYIDIGYRIGNIKNLDNFDLDVLSMAWGKGRASRLMKILRYEKGLVYGVSADYDTAQDYGDFYINTSTSKKHVNEVIDLIFKEIKNIKAHGLTKEEISFAKDKIIKSSRNSLQTSYSWVSNHSYSELVGMSGFTIVDVVRNINNVTNEKIIDTVNKYIRDDKWYMAICGNIKESDINFLKSGKF